MVSGPSLQQQLDQKVQEIKQAVSGIDEQKAAKRPPKASGARKRCSRTSAAPTTR